MAPVRVLLCDDLESMRLMLRTEFGFHPELEVVGEASDGASAVEMASALQPDVVILDLEMPVMDGFDALPLIRAESPNSKVIVLSAREPYGTAPVVASLGASDFLDKSTAAGKIADRVRVAGVA